MGRRWTWTRFIRGRFEHPCWSPPPRSRPLHPGWPLPRQQVAALPLRPPLSLWLRHPRRAALFVAVRPYTMLPYARLSHLYALADQCNRERIPGAFVQCGIYRGGSAAVLAATALNRPVQLFDSFQGCPSPGPDDVSMHGRHGEAGEAAASMADVQGLLRRLDMHRNPLVTIYPGWFHDTIPSAAKEMGPLALLHLDGDWFESTKVCMEHLYPLVVSGGIVYADDMGYWLGTKRAIAEYFVDRGMEMPAVQWVDHTGAWWRKGC